MVRVKKILLVGMPSIHFIKWIKHIEGIGLELYWFDILNRGSLSVQSNVKEITNWKKRKMPYVKGEYKLSKKYPKLYNVISRYLETTIEQQFELILLNVKPDFVHSFEMQSCSYPIYNVMKKYASVKWGYSCWGSDLYFYNSVKEHQQQIKRVLERIDYLITDCNRDYNMARQIGFSGEFLGVIPGGGGVDLQQAKKLSKPIHERKIILVKGYEHKFGRALNVIKALQYLISEHKINQEIVVFGAHKKVIDYIRENNLPFVYFERQELSNDRVLALMGQSLIYIGNSLSDGIPNTLIEAMCLGAFPIQSEVGGSIAEVVRNNLNGKIIKDASNIEEIKKHIVSSLSDFSLLKKSERINQELAKEKFCKEIVKIKITEAYNKVSIKV